MLCASRRANCYFATSRVLYRFEKILRFDFLRTIDDFKNERKRIFVISRRLCSRKLPNALKNAFLKGGESRGRARVRLMRRTSIIMRDWRVRIWRTYRAALDREGCDGESASGGGSGMQDTVKLPAESPIPVGVAGWNGLCPLRALGPPASRVFVLSPCL